MTPILRYQSLEVSYLFTKSLRWVFYKLVIPNPTFYVLLPHILSLMEDMRRAALVTAKHKKETIIVEKYLLELRVMSEK